MSDRHHYSPSVMHMGDCSICGHVQENPIHRMNGTVTVMIDLPELGQCRDYIAALRQARWKYRDNPAHAQAISAILTLAEFGLIEADTRIKTLTMKGDGQ